MINKGESKSSSNIRKQEDSDDDDDEDDNDNQENDDQENENGGGGEVNNRNLSKKDKKRLDNRYAMTKPILSKFGSCAMNYFRLPPRPTFLLGSLDQEPVITQKKTRQRRAVNDRADEDNGRTKIKELDADSNEAEVNSTVREIERVFKCLEKFHKKLNGSYI